MPSPSTYQGETSYDPAHSTDRSKSHMSFTRSSMWSRITKALTRKVESSQHTSSLYIEAFAAESVMLGGKSTMTTPPDKFFFPALGDTLRQVEPWLKTKASTTFDYLEIFTFRWGATRSASLVSRNGIELQTRILIEKDTEKQLLALKYRVGCEIIDSKEDVLPAVRVHPIEKVGSREQGFDYILKFNLYPRSEYIE